jgi:hypothetical protein
MIYDEKHACVKSFPKQHNYIMYMELANLAAHAYFSVAQTPCFCCRIVTATDVLQHQNSPRFGTLESL